MTISSWSFFSTTLSLLLLLMMMLSTSSLLVKRLDTHSLSCSAAALTQHQRSFFVSSSFVGLSLELFNCKIPRGVSRTKTQHIAQFKNRIRHLSYTSTLTEDNDDGSNRNALYNRQNTFFAEEKDFQTLGIQSPVLLQRIHEELKLTRPTAVQAAAFHEIADSEQDVTVGAETGSGKTLAYLLPLMDDILQRKSRNDLNYDYARAFILVPNKELVQQVVRMAIGLAGGHQSIVYGGYTLDDAAWFTPNIQEEALPPEQVVRIAIMPGGIKTPQDFQPFRNSIPLGGREPPVDLVVSTPASFGPLALSPKNIDMFADIQTVVVDEADMLLDGGYIRQLENVFMGFRRADRLNSELAGNKTQHVFVAATLPDYGLRSVDSYLHKKFPQATRVTLTGMHNARHFGLQERTMWIKEESKKLRLQKLVQMLKTNVKDGGLEGEKIMIFLNSVSDVEGASAALETAGIPVLSYHAKLPLAERSALLDRFRKHTSSLVNSIVKDADLGADNNVKSSTTRNILVCSDLAARGIDVPGVNAVVQLQMAGNVVGHLHRMGRCGRAGQQTGRGIVFYGEKEADLVKVIREAEEQQERMVLEGDVIDVEDEENVGTVAKAFSRKRAFTKKRKKRERESYEQGEGEDEDLEEMEIQEYKETL